MAAIVKLGKRLIKKLTKIEQKNSVPVEYVINDEVLIDKSQTFTDLETNVEYKLAVSNGNIILIEK